MQEAEANNYRFIYIKKTHFLLLLDPIRTHLVPSVADWSRSVRLHFGDGTPVGCVPSPVAFCFCFFLFPGTAGVTEVVAGSGRLPRDQVMRKTQRHNRFHPR